MALEPGILSSMKKRTVIMQFGPYLGAQHAAIFAADLDAARWVFL